MNKIKKPLALLLALMMLMTALPLAAIPAFAVNLDAANEENGYSVFIHYDGLENDTAAYASVTHEVIAKPAYVIPENPDTVKEGYKFNGFYCKNTGEMVQIGDLVPITDFTENEGSYHLYLSARFSEKEKPGVTYTDVDSYYVSVTVQYPDDPYAYLEAPDAGMVTYDDEFEKLEGQNVGTVTQPRQLLSYIRMGLSFRGFRSLLTGNVFETDDTLDVDKLPKAVYVGQELQEINDKEGYRFSRYEVNDYVEPIFEYLGAEGGFLDPIYECTINYYIPVDAAGDEEVTGDPLQFYSYEGADVYTLAMADINEPMALTCQPDYMEDLGYVFDGYGALDDEEITYPDGIIFMDQYSTNDNAGHLYYAVKLFYSESDEETTEEELLDAAKEKISAKYQDILDDDSASEGKKAVAADILDKIADASDKDEMKEICRNGEESIRLQNAKDEAIAEVMALIPEGDVSDEVQAVLDKAAEDIQACEDPDDFEDIISDARYEINRLIEEAANFEDAKIETVATIEALADESSSDTVKEIVADAVEAAGNAKNNDELSDILLNAQADVAAQKLSEAKEEAEEAILDAVPADAPAGVEETANGAIAGLAELDSITAVNEAVDAAKAQIAAKYAQAVSDAKDNAGVELEKAKNEAVSDEAKAAIDDAVAALEDAESITAVNDIVDNAKTAGEEADEALADTIEDAQEALEEAKAEATSDEAKNILDEAIEALNDATSLNEVADEKAAAEEAAAAA
ncbi:MAG: hypothetical protein MJ173_00005, partial [Clostridia bacterium]|nr:hypothetical protein [Clostridia bacterium]